MILTLKELASYLRVNERTILRMQKAGQVKGIKVGGQWRFNGSQIDSLFFPGAAPEGGEKIVPLQQFASGNLSVPISRMVREERMLLNMSATTAAEAIEELVAVVIRNKLCRDPDDLRDAVIGREKMLSTGVGNGIAVPHPRDPVPTLAESTIIVVGRSEDGVEFNAVDGQPVFLFFLIASQTVQAHLNILGRLAHVCSCEEAVSEMKAAGEPSDFFRALLKSERSEFLG